MKRMITLASALTLLASRAAFGDIKINEIYYSPEDPKEGRQFVEIINTAGAGSLANLWVLEIDGDLPLGVMQQDNPGQVVQALNLAAFTTAANGLFLWRDSDVALDTSISPGVQGPSISGTSLNTVAFSPILGFEDEQNDEDVFVNNVHTFLLVQGFTGAVGDDLDPTDGGTLDATKWTGVLDAITAREAGDAGRPYAAQFAGGVVFNGTFGPDVWARTPGAGQWLFFDSGSGEDEGSYVGPFFANDGTGNPGESQAAFQDGTEIVVSPASTFLYATPGAANLTGVPEPAAGTLAIFAAFVAMGARCTKWSARLSQRPVDASPTAA